MLKHVLDFEEIGYVVLLPFSSSPVGRLDIRSDKDAARRMAHGDERLSANAWATKAVSRESGVKQELVARRRFLDRSQTPRLKPRNRAPTNWGSATLSVHW